MRGIESSSRKDETMFFFGTKKDKNYFIAQKLFGILAEAAPEG